MAPATEVKDHPIPLAFPPIIAKMINDIDFDFDLLEIEDYFSREIKNIDDAEATFDDNGQITGLIIHKVSAVDPKQGITLQFEHILKFFMRHFPFKDLYLKN